MSNFGPDATRWYMISNANPWDNLKFDIEGIEESKESFWNAIQRLLIFCSLC